MPVMQPGTKIVVKDTHGHVPFRGDRGTIEKHVPFEHYYVNLERNGRQFVHTDDLEENEDEPTDEDRYGH